MIQSSNYADVKKRIELKDFIIKGKNNFNLIWFNSYYRLCYVEGILTREKYLIERSLNISFFNNLSRFLTLDRSRMINFSVTRGYREYPKCKKSWRGEKKEIWYIINIWTTCPVFLEKHIRLEFDSKRRFLAHCVSHQPRKNHQSSSSIDSAVISRLERLWRDSCGMSHSAARYREPRYAIWRDTKFFIAALIPTVEKNSRIVPFFRGKLCIRNFIATRFQLIPEYRWNFFSGSKV